MPPATTSAQALQNLQNFQSSEKAPQDILTSQEQSLGVPQAQQQVSGLRQAITNSTNLLNSIPSSVYGRTQNSLVTNAQAGAQIANEQAPVNTQLNKEQQDYTGASQDYSNLLGEAGTLAGLTAQGQQNQEGYLKDIYTALYGQEQDKIAQQQAAADLAEKAREANLSASSSVLSPSLASILASSAPQPSMKLKGSTGASGYAFTDPQGNPISANQYAQLTGQSLGQLLHTMGSSGDKYAQQAYNEIQANQAYYAAHPDTLQKEFSLLF